MKRSVGTQVTAAMCGLVLLLVVPAAAGLDLLIQDHFDGLRAERGLDQATEVDGTVRDQRARLADRVDLLASHPDLVGMIQAASQPAEAAAPPRDPDRLDQMRRQLSLDALTLVDRAGRQVASCSEGDKVEELLVDRPFRDALAGQPTQDTIRQGRTFRLRATRPVEHGGRVVGALMGGVILDRDDLVEIQRRAGFDAAFTFEGDVLDSTLPAFDRVPSAAVFDVKRALSRIDDTPADGAESYVIQAIELDGEPYDAVLCPLPIGGDADLVGTVVLLISASEMAEARESARWMAAGLAAAGVVLAFALAALFSSRITRPLRRLVEVARDLREGELSRRTELDRTDELGELGELAHAFDEMAAALEQKVEETQRLAVTDELTGLANRRKFGEELARELERSRRFGLELCLVMLDIDHFKRINDTRGHPVGDQVLVGIAEALRASLRNIDLACRYGGEEFALLLPATPGDDAVRVAERVRAAVADRPLGPDGDLHVTLSAGVARYPADGETAAELIQISDMRLYAAKKGGRNRVMGPLS